MKLMDLQQKGTFETGQEDTTEIPEELRLRLAYREAAVAVLACYFPEPLRPFVEVTLFLSFFVEQLSLCVEMVVSSLSMCVHCLQTDLLSK